MNQPNCSIVVSPRLTFIRPTLNAPAIQILGMSRHLGPGAGGKKLPMDLMVTNSAFSGHQGVSLSLSY
jgi:hypothetical protein